MPPIYLVQHTINHDGAKVEKRLIDAPTQAQAIRRVIASSVKCAVATPEELIECTKAGVEVEREPAA